MSFQVALHRYLAGVSEFPVPAARIYWGKKRPVGTVMPQINYYWTWGGDGANQTAGDGLAEVGITFDIRGASPDSVEAVRAALHAALHGKPLGNIGSGDHVTELHRSTIDDAAEVVDEPKDASDDGIYHDEIKGTFWYRTSIPSFA